MCVFFMDEPGEVAIRANFLFHAGDVRVHDSYIAFNVLNSSNCRFRNGVSFCCSLVNHLLEGSNVVAGFGNHISSRGSAPIPLSYSMNRSLERLSSNVISVPKHDKSQSKGTFHPSNSEIPTPSFRYKKEKKQGDMSKK